MTKLVIVLMLLITACATPYAPKSSLGGFQSVRIAENVFRVTFKGNAFTTREKASDFALLRSAELALANGFSYFVLVDSDEYVDKSQITTPTTTSTTAYGSTSYSGSVTPRYSGGYSVSGVANTNVSAQSTTYAGQTYTITKPTTRNTVLCFVEKPEGFSYNAAYLANNVRTAYGISKADELITTVADPEITELPAPPLEAGEKKDISTNQPVKEPISASLTKEQIRSARSFKRSFHKAERQQDWYEVLRLTGVSLSHNPRYVEALISRSFAYINLGYIRRAEVDLNGALDMEPNNKLALNNKGVIEQRRNNMSRAVALYKASCESGFNVACENFKSIEGYFPKDKSIFYYDQAMDNYSKGFYAASVKSATVSINASIDNVPALVLRSAGLSAIGKPAEAIEDAMRAILLEPDNAAAYNNLGYAQKLMRNFSEAQLNFRIACNLGFQLACSNAAGF